MINEWLNELSRLIIDNMIIGIILAFIGGILTSFTPCALTNIPLVISYTSEHTNNKKTAFKYSLVFCIGMAITYTVLGILSVLIGKIFINIMFIYYFILAVLMLIMSLQQFNKLPNILDKIGFTFFKRKGVLAALVLGMIGAIFSSPCSTPVLVAILSIISTKNNFFIGSIMLLMYAIGHSILILVVGTFWGVLKIISNSNKYIILSKIIKISLGIILVLISLLFFYLGFTNI